MRDCSPNTKDSRVPGSRKNNNEITTKKTNQMHIIDLSLEHFKKLNTIDLEAKLLPNAYKSGDFNIVSTIAQHKTEADLQQRNVEFEVGGFIQAILTKGCYSAHEYNKISSLQISPLEIIEKINLNVYYLILLIHVRTSTGFNAKHLVPYQGDRSSNLGPHLI